MVGVVSMLYTLVTFLGSYVVAWFLLGANFKVPNTDRHVLAWLIWDIIVHATIEGPFVVISLLGTVKDSNSILALMWKEYGKADARWLVSDPTIVAMEILTAVFVTLMCIVLVYAICKRRHYRHFFQISVCVCELYGGWMTFAPEILDGSKNLETSNFMYLYVYLIFYNGIWVVVPFLLLYQSWFDIKAISTPGASTPHISASTGSSGTRPTVVPSTSTSKKTESTTGKGRKKKN